MDQRESHYRKVITFIINFRLKLRTHSQTSTVSPLPVSPLKVGNGWVICHYLSLLRLKLPMLVKGTPGRIVYEPLPNICGKNTSNLTQCVFRTCIRYLNPIVIAELIITFIYPTISKQTGMHQCGAHHLDPLGIVHIIFSNPEWLHTQCVMPFEYRSVSWGFDVFIGTIVVCSLADGLWCMQVVLCCV